MKPALQLRLAQHLTLTPQLQQSIRLLQLSTLELQQEIEQALIENPLLEREGEWPNASTHIDADGSINLWQHHSALPSSGEPENAAKNPGHAEDALAPRESNADPDPDLDASADWRFDDRASKPTADEDDRAPLALHETRPTLRACLMEQIAPLKSSPRDKGLLIFLIDSLDDEGYLPESLDEMLTALPAELEFERDELQAALCMLQSFDPPGIGARSAAECLTLQLRRLNAPAKPLALTIVSRHLELLAAHDYARLKKILCVDDQALSAAHALIRSLTPFPGHAFAHAKTDFVVPDVTVHKTPAGWIAQLNPNVIPRLRINDLYAQILRNHHNESSTLNLQQKLQEARWLIKNIQQRFDTILKVSQAIVERQKSFFTHGEIAMRPLVLREIADTLGLHESTISRVTANKYMATPMGTFDLKYFFGSHVSTDAGGAVSSTAIRALIKQLTGAEDPKNPLSDRRIAELLNEQGFVVARRTVAKYRESLRIPAVSLRKSL